MIALKIFQLCIFYITFFVPVITDSLELHCWASDYHEMGSRVARLWFLRGNIYTACIDCYPIMEK